MKKLFLLGIILFASGLLACGGGSSDSSDNGDSSGMRELQLDETVTETIAEVGEVDWYHFNAVEANRTLTVSCDGTQGHAIVDFTLTVYEQNAAGEMVPIFGQSWPENSAQAADIDIKVHIDQPRQLYFAVRDFKDDRASDGIPYRIRVGYGTPSIDNETFAQAVGLTVGANQCQGDTIAQVDEVNCYRFQAAQEGVYHLAAQYANADVPVNLGLALYDADGQLIHEFRGAAPPDRHYLLMVHLTPGNYYLVVEDQGRNHSSPYDYTVCVDLAADAAEVATNDTRSTAESRALGQDGYPLDGSLEYIQDQDWYEIPVSAAVGTTSQNLRINLHTALNPVPESMQRSTNPDGYLISVVDAQGRVLHAYEHPVTATLPYNVQIGANPAGGPHYVVVQPVVQQQMLVAMPYMLQVAVVEVNDAGENADGTEVVAPLTAPSDSVTGKIFKLGDLDTYTMALDAAAAPKIVEVFFDAAAPSEVDYTVHVNIGGHQHTLRDINGTEAGAANAALGIAAIAAGAHMKSSFYVPAGAASEARLTVCDDQNNDGSDVDYTLRVNVRDVYAGAIGSVPGASASPVYFSEAGEQTAAADTNEVTMVEANIYNTQPTTFMANTALLRVGALDAQNQWRSPWIAGFVDYDGDRDLFELNFDAITRAANAPAAWYFDIQIQLYAANSPVEYSWVLFRDREPVNNVLLERTFWDDDSQGGAVYEYQYNNDGEGIVAGWADMEPRLQIINQLVPANGELFWVGNRWSSSKFYLSLQDFNRAMVDYTTTTVNEQTIRVPNPANQVPDNDWGSLPDVAPYYFQVTVTLHSGVSDPYAGQ
jgi:hypothetical protein